MKPTPPNIPQTDCAIEAQEIRKEYQRKYPNSPQTPTPNIKPSGPPKHSVLRRTKSAPKKKRLKKSKRNTKRRTKRGGAKHTLNPLLSQDEKNNFFISEIKRLNGEVSTLKTRVNICCGKSSIPKTTTEALQLMREKSIDDNILLYGRPKDPYTKGWTIFKYPSDMAHSNTALVRLGKPLPPNVNPEFLKMRIQNISIDLENAKMKCLKSNLGGFAWCPDQNYAGALEVVQTPADFIRNTIYIDERNESLSRSALKKMYAAQREMVRGPTDIFYRQQDPAIRSQKLRKKWICDIWVAPGVSFPLIQEKISEGYDIEFELDEDRTMFSTFTWS